MASEGGLTQPPFDPATNPEFAECSIDTTDKHIAADWLLRNVVRENCTELEISTGHGPRRFIYTEVPG